MRQSWRAVTAAGIAILMCSAASTAQEAILPQGDPRLQNERRDEVRDQRLKQQGQGDHYRVEGQAQPPSAPPTDRGPGPGLERQDTGLMDPSVNPGQAQSTHIVRGIVVERRENRLMVRDPRGRGWEVFTDPQTTGERDVEPGQYIETTITPEGRAITITKAAMERSR